MQQFEELTCGICQHQYSNLGDLIPRLLPECGHTFCTACLNSLLSESQGDFYCPEDNTNCVRKSSAELYPKNFALLRLAEKTMAKVKQQQSIQQQQQFSSQQNSNEVLQPQSKMQYMNQQHSKDQSQSSGEEELCKLHMRKLEIICINDKERICSNCALFGNHKNHDIRMESEVVTEIQVRTECLMEMYEIIEQSQLCKVDQGQVEDLYSQYKIKGQELKSLVSTKFKELKASLKIQEQQTETMLKKNLGYIESQFQIIRDVPKRLFDDADKWMKQAKVKLDNFTQNSENPTFIAFDMLESKKPSSDDIIQNGEKILNHLDGQKDVSVQKLDTMISQLNIEFDQNALKIVNEICKCNPVDGVNEQFDQNDKQNSNQPKMGAYSQGQRTQTTRQSNVFGEDDNDLLCEMSFTNMEGNSPMNRKTTNEFDDERAPLRKAQTFAPQQKYVTVSNQPKQATLIKLDSIESGGDKGYNQQITPPTTQEKEEPNEDLINEIENYLKDVMEQNDKVIDISETYIGNYGAKCVAAVLTLCDGLEEIRLSNCGIKDEGALELFEELKTSETVNVLDLTKNNLSEKCFDGLVQLLQINKKIQRVELNGLTVKNKFSMNKVKNFMNRIII